MTEEKFFNVKNGKIVDYSEIDEHEIVSIDFSTKTSHIKNIGINVQYETNSQYILFECERYHNGVDLSKLKFYFIFMVGEGDKANLYKKEATEVSCSQAHCRFMFLIDEYFTYRSGKHSLCVYINGKVNARNYVLKSKTFYVDVEPSLSLEDILDKIPESWTESVENKLSKIFVGTEDEFLKVKNSNEIKDYAFVAIVNGEDMNLYSFINNKLTPISGSGEGTTYTDTEGASQSLGGVKKGEKFDAISFQDLMWKILHPYDRPVITIGIAPATTLYDIVNDSLDEITISANVTKKSEEISYVKFYVDGNLVQTITENIKNGGVFKYTHNFDVPQKKTFTVKVETCDVETKTVVTAQTTITFIGRSYVGYIKEDIEINETSIKGLTPVLKKTKTYSYEGITTSGTDLFRICYAYPKELGELTSIVDILGFPYLDSYTKKDIVIDGINYLLYYLTEPVSVSDFLQKYT